MVKMTESEIAALVERTIRGLLEDIPQVKLTRIQPQSGTSGEQADFIAWIRDPDGTRALIFEAKMSGQPRLARQAANQLLQYLRQYKSAYGVFVAPYVTPRAAEVCTAQGIGFVDLSGNCRLSFGRVFVERQGRPNRFAEKRDLRTLYSPKASRILRVLLTSGPKAWRVGELAKEAAVSIGLVSNVKKLLADREWVREGAGGFELRQPIDLLEEWAGNYSLRKSTWRDYYSLRTPSEMESSLALLCSSRGIRYALAALSAAARIAPAVRYQRAFVYVEAPAEDLARELRLKEVPSGPNVTLLEPYDAGVFYGAGQSDGLWTTSPVQTYLDSITLKGRGEEAAAAILKEAIEPRW